MRLQSKITLLLAIVFLAYTALDFSIQRFVVYPSFVDLERDEAKKDLARVTEAVDSDFEHLSRLCFDWSAWTDTYEFMRGNMPDYHESNLSNTEWFTDIDLPVLYFVRPDGEVIFSIVLDPESAEPMALDWMPTDRFPVDHPLLAVQATKDSVISGMVMTEHGPLMVASRPILTSDYGGPHTGALIMGRFLNESAVESLVDRTRVSFTLTLHDASRDGATPEMTAAEASTEASASGIDVHALDSRTLQVHSSIVGLDGRPLLDITANVPRDISARGRDAVRFATISLVVAGLFVATALLIVLRRTIVAPLVRLTGHAARIGSSSDLTSRLAIDRSDEIGELSREFDGMVGKLAVSRSKLVDISRRAGMAEIATGVLHNVGNVLSSVNVLTQSLGRQVRESRVTNLQRAIDLLDEHAEDPAAFLTETDQGRKLLPYISEAVRHLAREREQLLTDIGTLQVSLGHVNQIVDAQQNLATGSEVVEPVSPADLAENAISVVEASLTRHKVQVVRDWEDLPTAMIDRGKTLQVLVNLLTNAKQAMDKVPEARRTLTIRLRRKGDRLHFLVEDQGPGIDKEHLVSIFAQGFTTKSNGQGMGLHYSALAAKEMGGSLQAENVESGEGACFELELPFTPVAMAVAA